MSGTEPIRLQKFIADRGYCSRRAAEALIATGAVSVNRQTAVLGQKIVPGTDRVVVEGQVLGAPAAGGLVLLVNKPAGVSCDAEPPPGILSVFQLVPPQWRSPRLRVAGELETEGDGLVVLTDDGDLLHRLVHPAGGILKRYRVSLKAPLPLSRTRRLLKGVKAGGDLVRAESVTVVYPLSGDTAAELEVALRPGRKREVRQLFDALRADIRRLRRVAIGGLVLKRIPLRGCRPLTKHEIQLLSKPAAKPAGPTE